MTRRRGSVLTFFAIVLLGLNPLFSHEPRAVAQVEGGVIGACVSQAGSCVLVTADECAKTLGLW